MKKQKEIPITESSSTMATFLTSQNSMADKLLSDGSSDNSSNDSSSASSESSQSLNGNTNRDKWTHSHEFVFAVAGCAIGLGNVWRFPYLCYKYGGGSFLIPYIFFLFTVGVPLMMMEVTMGQFMSLGGIEAWNMVPIAKGIGFAALVVVVYINIYYIVILSWILFYFFKSFIALVTGGDIPWSDCNHSSWLSSSCCSSSYVNATIFDNETQSNVQRLILEKPENCTGENAILPEAEYFSNVVLEITSGIEESGGMNWVLCGYLVLAWVICFVMVFRGAKSTGKAAYITATFPLVILMILVGRGVTLDGAIIGLKYYFIPKWDKLLKAETWMAAAGQILFSYAVCQGSLTSLGSYNKWSFNSIKWTVKLSFLNSFASMFAGVAIFSILGNLSHTMDIPIEEVADKGPGLAFIAYPRALANLPGSAVWNVLFFLMLLMLGTASQCAEVEGMIAMMVDLGGNYFKSSKPRRRQIFVAIACFGCFIMALPMVLRSGMYYFQLMDGYGASGIALMIIAICEVVAVAWIYGVDKYYKNLEEMCYHSRARLGKGGKTNPHAKPWIVFKYIWKYVTPAVMLIALLYNFAKLSPPSYESVVTGVYSYPPVGLGLAVFLVLSSILLIPMYTVYIVVKTKQGMVKSATYGDVWNYLITMQLPEDHDWLRSQNQIEKQPITDFVNHQDELIVRNVDNKA